MRSNSDTEPAPTESDQIKRRINADAVAGAVGFVFALAYLTAAFAIPESSFANAAVGPKALPVTIGVALAAASLVLAVRGLLREGATGEAEPGAEEPEEEVPAQSPVRFAVVAGLLLGYIFVLLPLGYVISTFLFIFGTTMYLDRGRPVRNVVYALAFSLVVYLVFTQLLTVRLPPGPLG